MGRFEEALRLFKKLNKEVASEYSNANRQALSATSLENAVLLSASEHDVLLSTETTATQTRCWKPTATSSGRAIYLYAASPL